MSTSLSVTRDLTGSDHLGREPPVFSVLLIDDDPALLQAHKRWIQRVFPGAIAICAGSASMAIAAMCTMNFNLVISDFDLRHPAENGREVLAWVKGNRPGLSQRFVFLTGSDIEAMTCHDQVLIKGAPASMAREYLTEVLSRATVTSADAGLSHGGAGT